MDNTESSYNATAITTSDTAELAYLPRGIYVGVGGDLNVDMLTGGTVLFKNVPTGAVLPIRVKRVRTTSTTATNMVGLY